jgi:hypothetical protein
VGDQAPHGVKPSGKIGEHFASYRRHVIPRDAGETQVRECQKAFYAGAHAQQLEAAALDFGKPFEPLTEAQLAAGAAALESLHLEVEAFFLSLVPVPRR